MNHGKLRVNEVILWMVSLSISAPLSLNTNSQLIGPIAVSHQLEAGWSTVYGQLYKLFKKTREWQVEELRADVSRKLSRAATKKVGEHFLSCSGLL